MGSRGGQGRLQRRLFGATSAKGDGEKVDLGRRKSQLRGLEAGGHCLGSSAVTELDCGLQIPPRLLWDLGRLLEVCNLRLLPIEWVCEKKTFCRKENSAWHIIMLNGCYFIYNCFLQEAHPELLWLQRLWRHPPSQDVPSSTCLPPPPRCSA